MPTRKRCPNGTRRNKTTGRCEPKQDTQTRKITRKSSPYKSKTKRNTIKKTPSPKKTPQPQPQPEKVCPSHKPLYNPKTKRCIMDTPANRKRIMYLKSGIEKKVPEPVIVEPKKTPSPKKTTQPQPQPQPEKRCPPEKPLYNPTTRRCLKNTLANLRKLGLEFKQKVDKIKDTPKFKNIMKSINLDSKNPDLLFDFDEKLDNLWSGTSYKIIIVLYYILQKHNNVCFFSGKIDTPRKRINYDKFHIQFIRFNQDNYKNRYQPKFNKETDIIIENKYDETISVNLFKRLFTSEKPRKLNFVDVFMVPKGINLKKIIDNCKKNNKRFFIGLIYLGNYINSNTEKHNAHENCFIYDIEKQELEVFEPNGSFAYDLAEMFNTKDFFNYLLEFFLNNGIPVKKFYKPIDYCVQGPQAYDYYSMKNIKNAPGGYCGAWSLYYLDARLSNPNIPRDVLITFITKEFQKNSAVFINSYSNFVLTNFLTNVLEIQKKNRQYPDLLKNFQEDKLMWNEEDHINNKLVEEITRLIIRM